MHHRAHDIGRLELLPQLELRWRAEVAHAVGHLGLVGALERLGRQRGTADGKSAVCRRKDQPIL